MIDTSVLPEKSLHLYNSKNFTSMARRHSMPHDLIRGIETAASVFPFRVNNYVVDELIDWDRTPDDPIFQLTFPQPEMLNPIGTGPDRCPDCRRYPAKRDSEDRPAQSDAAEPPSGWPDGSQRSGGKR